MKRALPAMRRRHPGQSLVIVALAATVLFGIIALGLDGGHLYLARRDVQNAADGGALAGAIDLIPTAPAAPPDYVQARYDAVKYALNQFPFTSDWASTHDSPATCAECQTNTTAVSYNGVVVTPATLVNGQSNRMQVDVQWTVPTTFASLLGFSQATIQASAQAVGGFRYATYAIFGFDNIGSGNSISDDQNGWAQVDDGAVPQGADACNPSADGHTLSNAKWHAPIPSPSGKGLNVNGYFAHVQASDDHALATYWQGYAPPPTPAAQPQPNYQPPSVASLPAGSRTDYNAGQATSLGFVASRATTIFNPGVYDSLDLSDGNHNFVFQNGVYDIRGSFVIEAGYVGNTINALPYSPAMGPVSNLPAAPDGTNGVEFVFEPSGSFYAKGGFISFVAPRMIPAPATNRIVMFFKGVSQTFGTGANPVVFTETIANNGVAALGSFHLWGTVFDVNFGGTHGSTMVLQATSQSEYAVTGQFIGPTINLQNGGFTSSLTAGTGWANKAPTACPPAAPFNDGQPAMLVQFKKEYAPTPIRLSFLVK